MTIEATIAIDRLLETTRAARRASRRTRARAALAIPAAVAATWTVYVAATEQWARVASEWEAGLTMVFGSFVAGSTPQGGGAVAFPVFTKVLGVEPDAARTFSLSIQAVGMGAASLAIIVAGRRVDWRVVAVVAPSAVAGMLGGLLVLGRPHEDGWPAVLPSSYVKVTFTLIIAAMALVVYLAHRSQLLLRPQRVPSRNPRVVGLLVGTGVAGGVVSSLVGSGADVFLFIAVGVLLGVAPRVAVTTSVVVMAIVSVVGLIVLGVIDGQLAGSPDLEDPDLFGYWLAAVPIVALGAPLGSWVAARISDRRLVLLVLGLALAEVATTAWSLTELYSNGALLAYTTIGAVVIVAGLRSLARRQRELFALPAIDVSRPILRGQVDAGPRYADELKKETGR